MTLSWAACSFTLNLRIYLILLPVPLLFSLLIFNSIISQTCLPLVTPSVTSLVCSPSSCFSLSSAFFFPIPLQTLISFLSKFSTLPFPASPFLLSDPCFFYPSSSLYPFPILRTAPLSFPASFLLCPSSADALLLSFFNAIGEQD